MVGVRKLVLDRAQFKEKKGEASVTDFKTGELYATIDDLLDEYFVVEISSEGSEQHVKAGLSKEKVLVRAYGKRQGEQKNE